MVLVRKALAANFRHNLDFADYYILLPLKLRKIWDGKHLALHYKNH